MHSRDIGRGEEMLTTEAVNQDEGESEDSTKGPLCYLGDIGCYVIFLCDILVVM